MNQNLNDDLLLVIIENLESNFDFKDFNKDILRQITPVSTFIFTIVLRSSKRANVG